MKALLYRLNRRILARIVRPTLTGIDNLPADTQVVYVLQRRSLTDLLVLDIAAQQGELASPFAPLPFGVNTESKRFFSLYRAKAGRMTMHTYSKRMVRLLNGRAEDQQHIALVPVSVFWGRSLSAEGSILSALTSEHWAVTGRLKRLINLFINRTNIFVHMGRPIRLIELAEGDEQIRVRRAARLLRVRLRQQRENTLGPDFSHRRTLLDQIVQSRAVRDVIEAQIDNGAKSNRLEAQALKHAHTIASDMSSPNIRVLAGLLSWFWNKIYDGIEVTGMGRLEQYNASHTLVYVPSHRSHVDYLLLSYLLYQHGFMIPHIAAGDNLNVPVLGGILRRGGAFFLRRSFRDDALYSAVFNEYVYQVYWRGHCVEFFPEGGRTRTGRLLPAKYGLLKMTLDHQQRGLPKPLALVPVYFGYEKLVEGSSYLSELRGADKKKESLLDVFRNIRLIRQNFGRVDVSFGEAIKLDEWLNSQTYDSDQAQLAALGKLVMQQINRHASINPVNLVATVTLATPKLAIEDTTLRNQIDCYQSLLASLYKDKPIRVSALPAQQVIEHVESLGLLSRHQESFGDVLGHDGFSAVLMTWYRNNVIHVFALPSLIACLLVKRRRPITHSQLYRLVDMIFPYLAAELSMEANTTDLRRCIDEMTALGLLCNKNDELAPPSQSSREHLQLNLLAQVVTQTLERMFIVIHLIAQGCETREELLSQSQNIAQKMSRLYGINAPEFFDQRLFDQFIDQLLARGVLRCSEDDRLTYDASLHQVLRAAEFVIDPQIRYGILSAATTAA